ncbi:MAG: tetratricopeptide repeat protein [Hyphomicrobiales bacterium]
MAQILGASLVVGLFAVMYSPARADGGDIWSGIFQFGSSGGSRLSTTRVISKSAGITVGGNKEAAEAYRSGDFAKAKKIWEADGAKGDLYAVWRLAIMHRLGQGVDADNGKAMKYYEQVANKFDGDREKKQHFTITVDSVFWVGFYYWGGDKDAGIKKRQQRAFRLFKLAANQGHPAAQLAVAQTFITGKVVKKNRARGMSWLVLAARKRHAPAMAELGSIYWSGNVVKKNRAEGLKWYVLATENACASVDPQLFDRFEAMYTEASDKVRSKAKALATRWNEEFPPQEAPGTLRYVACE